ncbi:MAG: hypothetical protein AUJ52_01005 [Elusimicrobia bacterium CG1_02_63_36]|nr:MAG: hypothetical protein AUJ52_01005 [Elusimicrobia bacterium CG1_02_63_36]
MRIGVDISAVIGAGGGLQRYTERLLDALLRVDTENHYFFIAAYWRNHPRELTALELPSGPNAEIVSPRWPQGLMVYADRYLGLSPVPALAHRLKLDIWHGVGNQLPRLGGVPGVVTLHHVGGIADTSGGWEHRWNAQARYSIPRANRVIAISEHTKADLVEQWSIPRDSISVVYHGVEKSFRPEAAAGALPDGVEDRYILFTSAIRKRKNLEVLVRAYARIKGALQLVLCGYRSEYYRSLRTLCLELGIVKRVLFLEDLSDRDLARLYARALLFVYPSKWEGFGLPILEAMACGTPVVAARAASLPEVAGDAALYFDPDSPEDLAAAIRKALEPSAASRLSAAGLARAAGFTWERTASETIEVYKRTLSR